MLNNGNFLGTTVSDFWRTDTAAFLAQNGLAATAPRFFSTELTLITRATTVCGGLGTSARARLRIGYIWCAFGMIRDRSSFFFLRRATRLRRELYEFLGVYKHTSLARLHGGSNATQMNLGAQPWTADFRIAVSLDNCPFF